MQIDIYAASIRELKPLAESKIAEEEAKGRVFRRVRISKADEGAPDAYVAQIHFVEAA